jgi:hypothetical protein
VKTNIDEFLFERYGVEQNVRHLTTLIFRKINQYIPKLIRDKEVIIKNYLEENYKKIKFKSDSIILSFSTTSHTNNPKIVDDEIMDFNLYIKIKLNKKEYQNRQLSVYSDAKESINHELTHLIELYYTGKKSKTFEFDERLKKHENRFSDYKDWLEITYLFYLMEEHEIRSRVSSLYETLKI